MERQKAYWKGPDLRERMIPGHLVADANGEFHWTAMEACHRCGGAGGSRHWPGFTCYECGGACRMPYDHMAVTEERALALKAAAEKAAAKREARLLKRIAEIDALLLPLAGLGWRELKDVAAWLDEHIGLDILWKIAHGKAKKPKPPTEKQLAVLVKLADAPNALIERIAKLDEKRAEEEARLVDLPLGRQALRGRFVHGKFHYNDFGRTAKGLFVAEVGDALAKVWMTVPNGAYRIEDDEVRVDRDAVFAGKVTIEKGEDSDKGFHYGKRPAMTLVEDKEQDHA